MRRRVSAREVLPLREALEYPQGLAVRIGTLIRQVQAEVGYDVYPIERWVYVTYEEVLDDEVPRDEAA